MKRRYVLHITCFTVFLTISSAPAAVSGQSLCMIVKNAVAAAKTAKLPPVDVAPLEAIEQKLEPLKTSNDPVSEDVERSVREVLSTVVGQRSEVSAAFFAAFSLPDKATLEKERYPRVGRIKQLARFIAERHADKVFNEAFLKKVEAAGEKRYGRPKAGEMVTWVINKRKVSGMIRYNKETFDIGIVTFPNEDLPNEYRLDLIAARRKEFIQKHYTDKRERFLKKVSRKIAWTVLKEGNYLIIDNEWFSPEEAYPALNYFLTHPDTVIPVTLDTGGTPDVQARILAGNNPTTLTLASKLYSLMTAKDKKEAASEHYLTLLNFWKSSSVAQNYPKLSSMLPPPDAPPAQLKESALYLLRLMLMEP